MENIIEMYNEYKVILDVVGFKNKVTLLVNAADYYEACDVAFEVICSRKYNDCEVTSIESEDKLIKFGKNTKIKTKVKRIA